MLRTGVPQADHGRTLALGGEEAVLTCCTMLNAMSIGTKSHPGSRLLKPVSLEFSHVRVICRVGVHSYGVGSVA